MSTTLRTRLQTSRVFLLSSLSLEERREYGKIIQKLGGVYFDSESFKACCTHLICGRLSRSEKFLGALATGKWILKPGYILACNEAEEWLPEAQFEWQPTYGSSVQSELLIYAPMRWRLHFALDGEPAFKGWRVSVLVSDSKRSLVYKRLLTSGGAKLYSLKLPVKDPMKVANTITFIFTDTHTLPQLLAMSFPEYGILLLKPDFIGDFLIHDPKPDPMDYIMSAVSQGQDRSLNASQEITCSQLSVDTDSVPTASQNSQGSISNRGAKTNLSEAVKTYSECSQSSIDSHKSVKPLVSTRSKAVSKESEIVSVKDDELSAPGRPLRNSSRILKAKQTSNVIQISSDSSPDCNKLKERLIKVEKKSTPSEDIVSMRSGHSLSQSSRRMSTRLKGVQPKLICSVKPLLPSQSQNSQNSTENIQLPSSQRSNSSDNSVTQSGTRTKRMSMRGVRNQLLADNLEFKNEVDVDGDSLPETEVQSQKSNSEEMQSDFTQKMCTRSTRIRNESGKSRNAFDIKKNTECKSTQESRSFRRISDPNVFSNNKVVGRRSKCKGVKPQDVGLKSSDMVKTENMKEEKETNNKVIQVRSETEVKVEASSQSTKMVVNEGSSEGFDSESLSTVVSRSDSPADQEPMDCGFASVSSHPSKSRSSSPAGQEPVNYDLTSVASHLPNNSRSVSPADPEPVDCDLTSVSCHPSKSRSASPVGQEPVSCDLTSVSSLPSKSRSTLHADQQAVVSVLIPVSTHPPAESRSESNSSQEVMNSRPSPVSVRPTLPRTRSGALRQIKSRRSSTRLKPFQSKLTGITSLLNTDKLPKKESSSSALSTVLKSEVAKEEYDAQDLITVASDDENSGYQSKQGTPRKLSQSSRSSTMDLPCGSRNTTPTKLVQNSAGRLVLTKLSPSPGKASPRKRSQRSMQPNLKKVSKSFRKASPKLELSQESKKSVFKNLSQSPGKASPRILSQSSSQGSPRKLSQSSLQDFGFSSASKRPMRRRMSQCVSRSSSCTGSPLPLSQGDRVCSQPESPRDCEMKVFLPSRAEVLEDDIVYVRQENAPSAASESEHRPTPPTNSLKSVCPAKRKIFEDETPSDTPPVKKRKMAQVVEPVRPWYPVSLGSNMLTHSRTDNVQAESTVSRCLVPREIPTSVCHLIRICVEEGFQKEALKMMQPYTAMCPSPHVLAILVGNVLLKAKSVYIAQRAHSLLMESLHHHPPVTKLLRDIYLTAFGMQNEEGVWAFVCSVIRGAVSESDSQDKHLLLLQYLLAVFRLDFNHFLNQCKLDEEKRGRGVYRSCMLVQCLWSPSYLMFSNLRTQTLLDLLEQALLLPAHSQHKRVLLESILGFVSLAAQACHIADNTPPGGHHNIGERTTLFVRELTNRIIGSCIEEETTLVTTLKNLQPSWLCTKICQILLGHMDDFLLMVPPDDKHVTLTKIVSQYFFLLPRLSRADNGVKPVHSLPNKRSCRSKVSSSEEPKEAVENLPNSDMAAKINKRNPLGETALHTACIKNDVPRLKQLLRVPGIEVNAQDNAGWTPLHEACNKGHVDCVETLLQYVPPRTVDSYFKKETSRRVDLMSATPDGVTPLHDAVANNRMDVCRLLLKHGGPELLKRETSRGQCAADLASTPSMQSLLATTPTPFKHRGDDLSSSQDSQQSPGPQHTSFFPSAVLYEQVLAQSHRPMRASLSDCCQYITMIKFLLQSYLRSSDILSPHQRTGVFSHQGTRSSDTLPHSAPSKENKIPARRGRQTRRPVRLSAYVCGERDRWASLANTDSSDGDSSSRKELSDLETVMSSTWLEEDLRVLRKMKHHLKSFTLHISKITSEQDFTSLQSRLSSLSALAACSRLLV